MIFQRDNIYVSITIYDIDKKERSISLKVQMRSNFHAVFLMRNFYRYIEMYIVIETYVSFFIPCSSLLLINYNVNSVSRQDRSIHAQVGPQYSKRPFLFSRSLFSVHPAEFSGIDCRGVGCVCF